MSNVAQRVLDQQKRRAQSSQFEPTDLTKYFTIALEKGIQRGEKIFRILPPLPDQSPFIEVYFHVVEVGGKSRKLWDPDKNEKKPSPLTEVHNALRATGDPADKILAGKFRSRLFYIIKGIERGKEHEGVKFWRVPHESKGGGVFDQITTIFQKYGDITDSQTGADLCISLTKAKGRSNMEYTAIVSILPNPATPLSANPELAKQWMEDPMTWENVYKKYDHEYLLLIAEGQIPTWSESENKWIPKPEFDPTASTSTQSTITDALPSGTPVASAPVTADLPVEALVEGGMAIDDSDLPF